MVKGTFQVIGVVALVALAAYWLFAPTPATAEFTSIGKNILIIASDLGHTLTGWFGTFVSDIANHK